MNNPDNFQFRRPTPGSQTSGKLIMAPGVVTGLVVLTVLAFFALGFLPARTARLVEVFAGVSPYRFASGLAGNNGLTAMFAPLVTHMFLHADIAHLGFNQLWLLAFGTPIARRFEAQAGGHPGRWAAGGIFVMFYFLCGAAGALTFIAFHPNSTILLVGASGGVMGLLGGLVRVALARHSMFGPSDARLAPLFSSGVVVWTAVVVGMNVVIGVFGAPFSGGNVAWDAHIGGYLFGLVTFPLFDRIAQAAR